MIQREDVEHRRLRGEEADLQRMAQQPARAAVMMSLGGGDPLILATIGQRYRFELLHPGQPLEPEPQTTLGPKSGMPLRLHRRTPARRAA
ncbi:hypothetical protein [Thiocapsa marina]|uniref:hypothetical protein n=1 Tax=Thiocapsa marina TaxID=244573 RepID=UPI0002E00A4A